MPGFLGLDFAPLSLAHRDMLRQCLEAHPQPLCDYTAASLVTWAGVCGYGIAEVMDTILISAQFEEDTTPHILQPLGPFPLPLQERLLAAAAGHTTDQPLSIRSVSESFLARHASFAKHFHQAPQPNAANYVYRVSDLAHLPGRRYAAKRNLIAQAHRSYPWRVSALQPEHAVTCPEVVEDIAAKRSAETGITLARETQALGEALLNFEPLGLRGLTLHVDGRLAACSIVDHLGPGTAVVLFERALRSMKGLSQVINHETARLLESEGYEFINREEDLGDPGLRKAKLSYHPIRLEPSYTLTFHG